MLEKFKSKIFYTLLFLVCFSYTLTARFFDYDLWARLIAGMGVFQTGHVIKEDFLSYTPTHIWYDHEWGSGLVFYFFQHYFGEYSLLLLQAVLLFLIFFTISKVIRVRGQNPYNFLFYLFAFYASIMNLNCPVRCHLFSFLFFTIFLYILEKARKGENRLLFAIPFLIIIWNNLHGGVVAGIGLLGMYMVGEALNRAPFKKYFYVLCVSVLALFINPWGYEYLKFLFMANTMKRADIIEWWSILHPYHLKTYWKFELWACVIVLVEALKTRFKVNFQTLKSLDKTKCIVLLSTLYLAIDHVKLIPLFVIAATCFVYEDFYKLIENIKFPVWKDKAIFILVVVMSGLLIVTARPSQFLGMDVYPIKEIEFMKINNMKGNLLLSFGYGSYASYKLYPDVNIFMDGRYEEVYYDNMVPLLKEFSLAHKGGEKVLVEYPPDIILIEKSYPAYSRLPFEWVQVYEGKSFGVFVKEQDLKPVYYMPSDDLKYYEKTLFDTSVKYN